VLASREGKADAWRVTDGEAKAQRNRKLLRLVEELAHGLRARVRCGELSGAKVICNSLGVT